MPEANPVRELVNDIAVPSLVLLSDIVGLANKLQQTPAAVIAAPPSDGMLPPLVAEEEVMEVTAEVADKAGMLKIIFPFLVMPAPPTLPFELIIVVASVVILPNAFKSVMLTVTVIIVLAAEIQPVVIFRASA